MLTAGHFMQHRYHAFNEPVTVEAPYGALGRAAVARFGDPPQAYWQAGAAAARWVAFVGVLGAAGAAAFVVIVHDRRPGEFRPLGREVTLAAVAAMVATLIEVGFGTAAEGGGLAGLGDADAWRTTVGGATAVSLLVRVVGLAGLLGALPRLWSPPAVRLAVVAGGVAVVVFSRAALAGVAVLVVAGVALAAIHTGALSAIVDTAYGRTLALKTVLVAVVITAAAYSRLRLVPAIQAGNDRAWLWLRRITAVEVAGLIAVLAVTAVLVHVRPPT